MLLCCVIVFLILLILLLFIRNNKKSSFFPQRDNTCAKTGTSSVYEYEKYDPKNSTGRPATMDCLVPGFVNPITLANSQGIAKLLYDDTNWQLWPGDYKFQEVDLETGATYDPSCINTGLSYKSCNLGDTYKMPKCVEGIPESREKFVSDRNTPFEKRYFNGEDPIENDIRFPNMPNHMFGESNYSGPFNAGGLAYNNYTEVPFFQGGSWNTQYIESQDELDNYKRNSGYKMPYIEYSPIDHSNSLTSY